MTKETIVIIVFLFLVVAVMAFVSPPPNLGNPGGGGGISGGAGLDPQTSLLELHLAIFCDDEDRDVVDTFGSRGVVYNYSLIHDGTKILKPESQYIKNDESFWWSHNLGATPPIFKFRWDNEPNVTIIGIDKHHPELNPKYIRFEGADDVGGSCKAYSIADHEHYRGGGLVKEYDSGWIQMPEANFSYKVDWDNNQSQCEGLGGAWLTGGDYDGMRCCGDDWIWINNLALNYQPRDNYAKLDLMDLDELCLYSSNQAADYGGYIDTEDYFGTDSYICDYVAMNAHTESGHQSYDPNLDLDDIGPNPAVSSDTTLGEASQDYHFLDGRNLKIETDLGKWSNNNRTEAMYCDMNFTSTGVTFYWKTIEDAVDNLVDCELHLGYNWTGTQCCGAPGVPQNYSDTPPECDWDYLPSPGIPGIDRLSRVTFDAELGEICQDYMKRNRACFMGKPVENNTIVPADPANLTLQNILNYNGSLLVCAPANIPPFQTVAKCEIRGSQQEFSVCAYTNDSWIDHNAAKTYLAYDDVPGYTIEELRAIIHESTVPAEVPAPVRANFTQESECCFDGCWAGDECVDNYVLYELFNDEWKIFDQNLETGKKIFMCSDGAWTERSDVQYDWFHNTDKPGFCPQSDFCVCDDGVEPIGCTLKYREHGCTNISNFHYYDHYCEGGEWTSRTKLIAAQLMELAGSSDYTLFCDKYNKSINYFEPIKTAPDNVNSFCVLNTGDDVIIGVSFNAPDPADFDAASLFDTSTGFITIALEDTDVVNCNYAVDNADTSAYGSYKRCMTSSGKYYYNNKTQSLIFSMNAVSAQNTLPNSYSTYNNEILAYFKKISDYIYANNASINAHERIMNIGVFMNANSFNRLYIGKKGQYITFGTVEKLYDNEFQLNRNFLGVLYQKMNIDCDVITESDSNAYCGVDGEDTYVLYRNEKEYFPHWSDLSAKLRFS